MKNLENKIIKKIYIYETKKTIVEIVIIVIGLVIAFVIGLSFGLVLINQLRVQQTLDVLDLFHEDIEIIKRYLGDVIYVLYEETPKETLLIILISLTIILTTILTFILNYDKIKKRIHSLVSFWLRHKK